MTSVLNSTNPNITQNDVTLRSICERAEGFKEAGAWTKEKFDSMVEEILKLGDSDNLEPLFMLAPPDYGRAWVEARIVKRGKPVTL